MQNGQQDSAPNPSHGETPGVFRVGRGPAQKDVILLFIGGLFQPVYCNIGSGRKPNVMDVSVDRNTTRLVKRAYRLALSRLHVKPF